MEAMDGWTGTGRALPAALLTILLGTASPVFADLTIFAGSTATPHRTTVGVALGLSLQPVGLEFEYADTSADTLAGSPARRTGLFNLVLGTSFRSASRIRFYGALGAGAYREHLAEQVRTGLAASGGGGIYFRLAGPLRIRLDYRLFALRGNDIPRRSRRIYAGLDLAF
jgi:hypothetical protein